MPQHKRMPLSRLPLFERYPELLAEPPTVRWDEKGNFYLEWRARRDHEGIVLVLHAIVPAKPLWSYAISDDSTNTIRHYAGTTCDPEVDTLVDLQVGRTP